MKLAITIDDLPNLEKYPNNFSIFDSVKKMADVLNDEGIKGVYSFANMGFVEESKTLEKALHIWRAAGHFMGNHTYSHLHLSHSTLERFENDILKNQIALAKYSDDKTPKIFRFPYLEEGETPSKRGAIRKFLQEQRYLVAPVTVDFGDWEWNDPYILANSQKNEGKILNLKQTYLAAASSHLELSHTLGKILFDKEICHVLLLHSNAFTAEMLRDLILEFRRRNVSFVSLEEALKDSVYSMDSQFVFKEGRTFLFQVLKMRKMKLGDHGLSFPIKPKI